MDEEDNEMGIFFVPNDKERLIQGTRYKDERSISYSAIVVSVCLLLAAILVVVAFINHVV